MIIYSKTLWGLPLLSRVYGSALPRALAPACASGLVCLLLMVVPVHGGLAALWAHPYAFSPFVLIVSFVLAFRSNYAYQRHWEAYTNKQMMTARWVDAVMQAIMFDRYSLPAAALPAATQAARVHQAAIGASGADAAAAAAAAAAIAGHQQFAADLVHLASLLHGVACQALRRDPELANLIRHSEFDEAPPQDAALLDRANLPTSQAAAAAAAAAAGGSGAAAVPGAPAPAAAVPAAAAAQGSSSSSAGGRAAALFGSSGVRLPSRFNWRDIFMLRGSSSVINKYNAATPLPVIGGLSAEERSAIGCCSPGPAATTPDSTSKHHASTASSSPNQAAPWFRPRRSSDDTGGGSGSGAAAAAAANGHLPHQQPPQLAGVKAAGSFLGSFRRRGHPRHDQQQVLGRASRALSSLGRLSRQQQRLSADAQPQPQPPSGSSRPSTAGCSSTDGGSSQPGGRPRRRRPRRGAAAFRVSLNSSCCAAHLPYMERPALVLSWLHELLLQRQAAGGLVTPAPILARVYQCLSDGLAGFEQCRKLADAPFPFPWAQFVLVMLVIFTLTLPLMVLAYVQNSALAVVLTVVTVGTYFAVNEVARDVEDPFLYEPNVHMQLANSQYFFNELLLTLSSAQRPASSMRLRHLRLPSVLGSTQPWQQQGGQQPGAAAAAAGSFGSGLQPQQRQFDSQAAAGYDSASCFTSFAQQSTASEAAAAAAAGGFGFGFGVECSGDDDVVAARDLSGISEATERERSAASGAAAAAAAAVAAAVRVSTAGAAAGAVRASLEGQRSSSSQQQQQRQDCGEDDDEEDGEADEGDTESDGDEQPEARGPAGVLVQAAVRLAPAGDGGDAGPGCAGTGDEAV